MSALDAHVVVRRDDLTVDVALSADGGDVVGLLGPNGAGKTTVLRALAGLTALSDGHVAVAGLPVEGPGVRTPTAERRLGMVFQETLLFPHLSVIDNVAFGARHRGRTRRDARGVASDWLARTGLEQLAERRPAALSGGQARRVAITRALASDPELLLLDEPLSSLDATAAMSLRSFLRRHIEDFPGVTVLVTHDALDALVLTDQVVVLADGRVEQVGPPTTVSRQPRSAHVASLMGLNLVRGIAEHGVVRTPDGADIAVVGHETGDVFCSFPPTAVVVAREQPRASARNVWPGRVVMLTPRGDSVRLHVDGPVPLLAEVTPHAVADLGLEIGTPVWTAVKAVEVAVYPA